MENLHNMVKHFSCATAKRKNYDSVLDEHRRLPTNQFEQHHDGTRIMALNRLLKSVLTLKIGTHVCCNQFNTSRFLIDEE